ncbi:c-type cytochrome [Caulobacter sp. LARHSG274]
MCRLKPKTLVLGGLALAAIVILASACGRRTPDLAPATASPEQVARGRYLAVAGDCAACHTRPGGAPFAGGRAVLTPFGAVFSTNLTPDATGLRDWTAGQFHRALHQGVGARGRPLYPAFPYLYYTRISRADSDALFAYLRTLSAAPEPPIRNQLAFPFNIRRLLIVWNRLFLRPGPFRPDPARSPAWNRGAYLVEGPGHCGACHTPINLFGAPKRDRALQGGSTGLWTAPDLTPNPRTGLGAWRTDEIAAFLKTGRSPHGAAFGDMRDVVASSTAKMADADLAAIAVYLKTLPPAPDRPATPRAAVLDEGRTVWLNTCAACHGAQAQGAPGLAPALGGSSLIDQDQATSLLHVVLNGTRSAPADLPMPAFRDRLDDRQIAALVTYVRQVWGGRASAVGAGEVARLRHRLPPGQRAELGRPKPTPGLTSEIDRGERLYQLFNCDGCHARGGGDIGPALMDDAWRYGGDPTSIRASIARGRPNGMPAFAGIIPERQIAQIAAYVGSLSAATSTPAPAKPGHGPG